MSHWATQGAGLKLFEQEKQVLSECLPQLFGYHLLLIGKPELASSMTSSLIHHRVHLYPSIEPGKTDSVASELQYLPIATESIDVVLLPHLLEELKCPRTCLNEVSRVLRPNGHLVISGTNPWSLWGGRQQLGSFMSNPKQTHHSAGNLNSMLHSIDFDVVGGRYFAHCIPTASSYWEQKLQPLASLMARVCPLAGNLYTIVAVKRSVGLTPIRPHWRRRVAWVSGEAGASQSH